MTALAGLGWRSRPTAQRPPWPDEDILAKIAAVVAGRPELVPAHEIRALTRTVAAAARGECWIVQSGDCAETFDPPTYRDVLAKARLLHTACRVFTQATGRPAIPIGRIAGQYAKPRSSVAEEAGGMLVPAFRGHAVNDPRPDPVLRIPDPERLLTAHDHARAVLGLLRETARVHGLSPHEEASSRLPAGRPAVWTSHEALLLDYEDAQVRTDASTGARYLTSTHLPWIGARTCQPDGAHVAFAASIANTVGVKVSPDLGIGDLLDVCERLDPRREPGRLVLIARFGADAVGGLLPAVAEAVREAGHPAVWLCDPMHGNTEKLNGLKTRRLSRVVAEIRDFARALASAGVRPGGVHLEATADPVTECVEGGVREEEVCDAYYTACDPRLNARQTAIAVRAAADAFRVAAWAVERESRAEPEPALQGG